MIWSSLTEVLSEDTFLTGCAGEVSLTFRLSWVDGLTLIIVVVEDDEAEGQTQFFWDN